MDEGSNEITGTTRLDVPPAIDDTAPDQSDEMREQRDQIEQTRADLSKTIDAIQGKLDPQTLFQQAKDVVHDAGQQAKEVVHEATTGTLENFESRVHPEELIQQAKEAVQEVTRETIDRIHDKISPQALIREAKDAARETAQELGQSARGAGMTLKETIKANPVPAALAGLGLGWLYISARRTSEANYALGQRPYRPAGPLYRGPEGVSSTNYGNEYAAPSTPGTSVGQVVGQVHDKVGQVVGDVQDRVGDVAGRVQDKVGDVAGQVHDKVGDVAGQVRDTVGQVAGTVSDKVTGAAGQVRDTVGQAAGTVHDRAGDLAGQVQDSAVQLGHQAQDKAQWAVGEFQWILDRNPLAVAGVAAVLGLAVGLIVPETQKEHEVMGEARDRVVDSAQQTAQDLTQKAQSVVTEAVGAAKDEASHQGLTPEAGKDAAHGVSDSVHEVVDKVKSVVTEAVGAGLDEAKNQGLKS